MTRCVSPCWRRSAAVVDGPEALALGSRKHDVIDTAVWTMALAGLAPDDLPRKVRDRVRHGGAGSGSHVDATAYPRPEAW